MLKPIFCITSDIDWAGPFCVDYLIRLFQSFFITPTLFATHDCPVVRDFVKDHPNNVGVHPNFRVGSTHGSDYMSIIDHVFSLYPKAKTFRSHAFYDSTDILEEMAKRGVKYDSNLGLQMQAGIAPLRLSVGSIMRLPVFWSDDDHWIQTGGDWNLSHFAEAFMLPGLKIINVHPFSVTANVHDGEHYLRVKKYAATWHGEGNILNKGFGVRTFLIDLIRYVQSQGLKFYTLDEIYQMEVARPRW